MPFKREFGDGSGYVCEGDSITCELDGFTCTARIYRDDCGDTPPERCDGFWPSLDPKSAGYIGPKSKRALAKATWRAQALLDSWKRDEWFYCGVAVSIERAGVQLTGPYDFALWGIECNYPTRGRRNRYLRTVANELIGEAIDAANAKLDTLLEGLK